MHTMYRERSLESRLNGNGKELLGKNKSGESKSLESRRLIF